MAALGLVTVFTTNATVSKGYEGREPVASGSGKQYEDASIYSGYQGTADVKPTPKPTPKPEPKPTPKPTPSQIPTIAIPAPKVISLSLKNHFAVQSKN